MSTADDGRRADVGDMGGSAAVSLNPRARGPDCNNAAAIARKRKGVEHIKRMMIQSKWIPGMHRGIAKRYGVAERTAMGWAVEASVAVKAALDPHWLTAMFANQIAELDTVAGLCRGSKQYSSEIAARKAIVDACIKNASDEPPPRYTTEREMVVALIAKGWTPPPVAGLPAPNIDDPELEGSEME